METTGGTTPKVLDVGQCDHDHGKITGFLKSRFGAEVGRAHGLADARDLLRESRYDLILVNRLLDVDQNPGVEVIRSLKNDADPNVAAIPVMLVSNFPEAQQEAVAVGAAHGFGKAELDQDAVADRVGAVLR